jgi:hypothetical protein
VFPSFSRPFVTNALLRGPFMPLLSPASFMPASCWPGGLASWQPGSLAPFLRFSQHCSLPSVVRRRPLQRGVSFRQASPSAVARPPWHVLGRLPAPLTLPHLHASLFLLSLPPSLHPSLFMHIRGNLRVTSLRQPLGGPGTSPPDPCGVPNSWFAHLHLLLTTRQGGRLGMDAGLVGAWRLASLLLGERKCESESSPSYFITSHHIHQPTARLGSREQGGVPHRAPPQISFSRKPRFGTPSHPPHLSSPVIISHHPARE